mgnify:CR=1 FL=1
MGQILLEHAPLGAEKDVFGRYLRPTQLRNLNLTEDTATKRPCWVYYTRMHSLYLLSRVHPVVYIIYNTLWRGLAELLISLGRQCEGLVGGISKEVSPTSFYIR